MPHRLALSPRAAARRWRRRAAPFAGAGLLLLACYTGTHPSSYGPAQTPYGAGGTVFLVDGRDLSGELLAVRDNAYVVMIGRRVTVVPFAATEGAHFADVPWYGEPTRAPSDNVRERLRLLSRFPYGLPDTVLAELLRHAGQEAPDVVAAPPP